MEIISDDNAAGPGNGLLCVIITPHSFGKSSVTSENLSTRKAQNSFVWSLYNL